MESLRLKNAVKVLYLFQVVLRKAERRQDLQIAIAAFLIEAVDVFLQGSCRKADA